MSEAVSNPPRARRSYPPRPTDVPSVAGTGHFQGVTLTAKTLRNFRALLTRIEAAEKNEPKLATEGEAGKSWSAKREAIKAALEAGKSAGLI